GESPAGRPRAPTGCQGSLGHQPRQPGRRCVTSPAAPASLRRTPMPSRSRLPADRGEVRRVAELIKLASDPTRLGILLLLGDGDRSASGFNRAFPISASTVNYHLSLLRVAGLVERRRDGRQVIFA